MMAREDFQRTFNEALSDEQDALKEEHRFDFVRRMLGSWVSINANQAIWRATGGGQFEGKVPDGIWGYSKLQRNAEVVFMKNRGKVIVDGPTDVVEALIRALKTFTKPDDNAVMPIYDVAKISF